MRSMPIGYYPELPGHHYAICGGCQMHPLNMDANCDLYDISCFATYSAGTSIRTKTEMGVKLKT